jgi:hypothetical protein
MIHALISLGSMGFSGAAVQISVTCTFPHSHSMSNSSRRALSAASASSSLASPAASSRLSSGGSSRHAAAAAAPDLAYEVGFSVPAHVLSEVCGEKNWQLEQWKQVDGITDVRIEESGLILIQGREEAVEAVEAKIGRRVAQMMARAPKPSAANASAT